MTKDQFITAVVSADIIEDDWIPDLNQLNSRYAAGYLSALIGRESEYTSQHTEEFREILLRICTHNIWK